MFNGELILHEDYRAACPDKNNQDDAGVLLVYFNVT